MIGECMLTDREQFTPEQMIDRINKALPSITPGYKILPEIPQLFFDLGSDVREYKSYEAIDYLNRKKAELVASMRKVG